VIFLPDLFQRPFMRAREVYMMGGKDKDSNMSTEEQEYVSDSDVLPTLLGAEEDSPLKGKGKQAVHAKLVAPKVKSEPEEVTLSWSDSDKGNNSIGT
jgi:hypothetical protein